jgi:prepilin-type N-terminal cleavage/methylation domain-containing protein
MNSRHIRKGSGFTLIELLVVVAIIALLISILLPSLAKARAQARSTLCASRIGQLLKAALIYGADNDEVPPFGGVGFENLGSNGDFEGKPRWSFWAEQENWCLPTGPQGWVQTGAYQIPQTDWNPYCKVENGKMFPYARFANLYRCPEFERVQNKDQNAFNYTRGATCRKVLSQYLKDAGADGTFDPGPMLKASQIYSPAAMFMFLDEQWDFHCASIASMSNHGTANLLNGYWMGMDPIHGVLGDMVGSYHGSEGKTIKVDQSMSAKQGSMAYYDGHVEPLRDPFPYRTIVGSFGDWGSFLGNQEAYHVLDLPLMALYAQRGVPMTHEQVIQMILGG